MIDFLDHPKLNQKEFMIQSPDMKMHAFGHVKHQLFIAGCGQEIDLDKF